VEQAEIVADEAGRNVDGRAPVPLVEQPAASHAERFAHEAALSCEVGDARRRAVRGEVVR
jgi:hypothetical protein